jgi:hypothetical protein
VDLLVLVFSAIYLFDCILCVDSHVIGFQTFIGRAWKIRHGAALLGPQLPSLFLCNPLPPLGTIFLSEEPPLVISSFGVSRGESSQGSRLFNFLRYEEIRSITPVGARVLINEEEACRTLSGRRARQLVSVLRHLQSLPTAERKPSLRKHLTGITDVNEIGRLIRTYREVTNGLRVGCNLIFVFLFVVTPWAIFQGVLLHIWVVWGISLLVLLLVVGLDFWHAYGAIFPEDQPGRIGALVPMLLFPPSVIRAADLLSRDLLSEFHPVSIAQALGTAHNPERLTRKVLRQLRFPTGNGLLPYEEEKHQR